MLKFHNESTDRDSTTREGAHLNKNGLRTRKRGMPRQSHVIPELSVLPWENRRERIENRLIAKIDTKYGKVG